MVAAAGVNGVHGIEVGLLAHRQAHALRQLAPAHGIGRRVKAEVAVVRVAAEGDLPAEATAEEGEQAFDVLSEMLVELVPEVV